MYVHVGTYRSLIFSLQSLSFSETPSDHHCSCSYELTGRPAGIPEGVMNMNHKC